MNRRKSRCGALASVVVVLAVPVLGACSQDPQSSPEVAVAPSVAPSVAATSASPAPSERPVVGADLPERWVSAPLSADGEGYGLRLTPTSDPDLFDGQFFRREADGAVTDQHVITLRVTSPTDVEVTWPGGSNQSGGLTLEADGAEVDEIDLAPGCLAFLGSTASTADCILVPESAAEPIPSASPDVPPTIEEAMGYLCSVGVAELENVTEPASDFFSTAVLQAALETLDLGPGAIDGRYGTATRDAVLVFQDQAGIKVDGLVGPQTWTSLQKAACAVPEDPAERSS